MNNTRPSFYLISSAVDGNVNAIEKIRETLIKMILDFDIPLETEE